MKKQIAIFTFIAIFGISGLNAEILPGLNDSNLNKLVVDTVLDFDSAIKATNFDSFYSNCASSFREKYSPSELLLVFASFISNRVNLSSVKNSIPLLTDVPNIDTYGDLKLSGFFLLDSGAPNIVKFTIEYRKEKNKWMPISFNVETSYTPKVPSSEITLKMIEQILISFNDAVRYKTFESFYDLCASPLKQKISPEQFKTIFGRFIKAKVDISKIVQFSPVISTIPHIDNHGDLIYQGYYKNVGNNERIDFRIDFREEGGKWKLIYFDINIK